MSIKMRGYSLAKITKWKIKPRRANAIRKAPIDMTVLCKGCGNPVKASSVKEIGDLEILITYSCMCGLITKRLYKKAPTINDHQDCKEVSN